MNAVHKTGIARLPRAQKTMTIGAVLAKLSPEFPDISVSKIRYLESEGLISPQRTNSRYRRFTAADVDRLRYILIEQRDNYLPLKVIKQQLDAMDEGTLTALMTAPEASPMISPERFVPAGHQRLTDSDVAHRAGIDVAAVTRLTKLGVIRPDASGFFHTDDISVVAAVSALSEYGLDDRHIKAVKNTANRQADLITQAAKASSLGAKDNAEAKAQDCAMQLSALVVSLHATLVKNVLRHELGG